MATWKKENRTWRPCVCVGGPSSSLPPAQQVWGSVKDSLGSAQASSVQPITLASKLEGSPGFQKYSDCGVGCIPAASFLPPPLLQNTLARGPGCWYHNMVSHIETRQSFSMWTVFSTTYGGENRQWEGTWFVTVHPNVRSIVLPKNDRLK